MNGTKSGMRKAKCGKRKAGGVFSQRSAFSFQFSNRRGFTLVEMLIVVAIIGMLASISLAALAQARSFARVERTKATIAKLNDIIMTRYASYQTRRVPLSTSGLGPQAAARLRLAVLRQLMRLEMPERLTDIVTDATTGTPTMTPTDPGYLSPNANMPVQMVRLDGTVVPGRTIRRPALSKAYLRRWRATTPNNTHTPAELLYMIVTLGDPDARDQFMDSEIADLDNDNLPEFIDGWGHPIYFLRWAPAFDQSDIQLLPPVDPGDAASDHDPFDQRKIDTLTVGGGTSGWRLIPLIYSAGPDGDYGIGYDPVSGVYVWTNDTYSQLWGASDGSGTHYDNIHNHRIEAD